VSNASTISFMVVSMVCFLFYRDVLQVLGYEKAAHWGG
jgi:hypothetical protein